MRKLFLVDMAGIKRGAAARYAALLTSLFTIVGGAQAAAPLSVAAMPHSETGAAPNCSAAAVAAAMGLLWKRCEGPGSATLHCSEGGSVLLENVECEE